MSGRHSGGPVRAALAGLRAGAGLVLVAVAVTALAGGIHAARTPSHTATSRLLLRPALPPAALRPSVLARTAADQLPPGIDLSADTEAALLVSPLVAERVARAMHLAMPPEQLAGAVSASPVTSTVIEVRATAVDPEMAATLANGFADQYLAYRREATDRIVDEAVDGLGRRTTQLRARVDRLDRLLAAPGVQTGRRTTLSAERDQLLATATALDGRAAGLRASALLPVIGGDVIERAVPPAPGAAPMAAAALGVLLGGALGSGLALLRIETGRPAGGRATAGIPVIATLPRAEGAARPVLLRAPDSAAASAYLLLYATLVGRGVGRTLPVVLLVGAERAEETSVVAGNLAVTCARAGVSTLAVSLDFDRPGLAAPLGIDHRDGLAAALRGEAPWLAKLVVSATPNLLVLPAGSSAGRRLATPARLREVLDQAAGLFDVVIVEAPTVSDDVLALAEGCDAVLLVAAADQAGGRAVGEAARALGRVDAALVGVVLTEGAR